jgi:hypothetical protein
MFGCLVQSVVKGKGLVLVDDVVGGWMVPIGPSLVAAGLTLVKETEEAGIFVSGEGSGLSMFSAVLALSAGEVL